MIMLSSGIGHEGVITRSVPNSCEKSQELLSTTRIIYSCKTGKNGNRLTQSKASPRSLHRGH